MATAVFQERVEALARVCVPVLTARMARSARRYETLAGELAAGARLEVEALRGIEEDELRGPELGYLLGVLAAARGTDVLLVRRSVDGARSLVALLGEALGARMCPCARSLPDVAPAGGWQAPLSLGLLFHAGLSPGGTRAWSLEHADEGWRSSFVHADAAALARTAGALEPLGVRALADGALLPASWFAAPTGARGVLPHDRPASPS